MRRGSRSPGEPTRGLHAAAYCSHLHHPASIVLDVGLSMRSVAKEGGGSRIGLRVDLAKKQIQATAQETRLVMRLTAT